MIYQRFNKLILLLVLILLCSFAPVRAAVFQSEPKGFSAGNTSIQLTAPAENLIYGVVSPSVVGSFVLFQNGSGNDKFRVDNAGNTTAAGFVKGNQLCIQGDCRASWAAASPTPSLQAVTTVGASTNLDISTGSIGAGVYVSAGNSGNRARLGELNSRGGLYTEGESWFQSGANKIVWSDSSNNAQMNLAGADLTLNGKLTVGGKVGLDGNGVNSGFSLNASNINTGVLQANYLDALANAQIRFDSNNDGSGNNNFHVNNGANGTVLTVNELGNLSSLRDITFSGDAYLSNGKSLRVDNAGANTTLYLGNYGDGGGFAYGSGKTASWQVEGDVHGNQLCMQGDCKASWAAVTGSIGSGTTNKIAKWTSASAIGDSQIFDDGTNIGFGTNNLNNGWKYYFDAAGAQFALGVNGGLGASAIGATNASITNLTIQGQILNNSNANEFYINGNHDVQIRVDADQSTAPNNSKFKVNNGDNNTILSVDETGVLTVSGGDYNTATIKGASGKNIIGEAGNDVLINSGSNKHTGNVWIDGGNFVVFNATAQLKNDTQLSWSGGQVRIGPLATSGYKLDVNGQVNTNNAFCISGNCKTSWGPNSTAYGTNGVVNADNSVRTTVTLPGTFDGTDWFCPAGYVVIGFRNQTPGVLICGKMW